MSKKTSSENKMLREFFLGFVKVHVLHHARRGAIYGVWFLEELERHDYHLSPGTLYPLLHGLEGAGYLEREDRVVDGKVRKYYGITTLGAKALKEAKVKMHELIRDVVQDDDDLGRAADPTWKRPAAAAR